MKVSYLNSLFLVLLGCSAKAVRERAMKIFWSWQSDHDGKISRHFIRSALQGAVTELKQSRDIEEPSDADRRVDIHVDHSTAGLTGMPDIAASIFEKINRSAIFLGDVTPVGTSPSRTDADGEETGLRPLMNPNVAIELGYALKALGWANCLAVFNAHYGSVEALPFDIQQKRWPIIYELKPGATKQQIADEKEKLRKEFVSRLRPYLRAIIAQQFPFKEMPVRWEPAFFFTRGETLARRGNVFYTVTSERVLFFRIIPTSDEHGLVAHDVLRKAMANRGAFGFSDQTEQGYNKYGTVTFEPRGDKHRLDSIVLYTHTGEIWGINASVVRTGELRKRRLLRIKLIEQLYRNLIPGFLEVVQELGVQLPVRVVFGVAGIKDFDISADEDGERQGRMILDNVLHRDLIHVGTKEEVEGCLLRFFEKIFAGAGKKRPQDL